MEKIVRAFETIRLNKEILMIKNEFNENFEKITSNLNENFIRLYFTEKSKPTSFQNFTVVYGIYIQYYSLLTHNELSKAFNIQDSLFNIVQIMKNLTTNLEHCLKENSSEFLERVMIVCLNLSREILSNCFNDIISNNYLDSDLDITIGKKFQDYLNSRANLFLYIYDLLGTNAPEENKELYYCLLNIQSKSLSVLLEIFIYSTSEKLSEHRIFSHLKYDIPYVVTDIVLNFLKKNFLKFFIEFNHQFLQSIKENEQKKEVREEDEDKDEKEENNNQIDDEEQEIQKEKKDDESLDENELKQVNNEIFNHICGLFKEIIESFSRLLILNLGFFKNKDFCCMYFESLLLIKMPHLINNITTVVVEKIYEKELENYSKLDTSIKASNALSIIFYYISKITMKIFNNEIIIINFDEIKWDEKISMIKNLFNCYSRLIRKLKPRNKDVILKDKVFFENFVFNCLSIAVERVENKEDKENSRNYFEIVNVRLLEIMQIFLKPNLYFEPNDYKKILLSFIQISSKIESNDNIKGTDVRIYEKFKSFLVSKAKIHQTALLIEEDFENMNLKDKKKKSNDIIEEKIEEESYDSDKKESKESEKEKKKEEAKKKKTMKKKEKTHQTKTQTKKKFTEEESNIGKSKSSVKKQLKKR